MESVRCLFIGPVFLFAAACSTFAETPAATVVEAEKIVEAQSRGAAWKAATVGLELGSDDKLRTGEYSRALIRLNDLTTMRLDELTTIEISRAVAARKADTLGVKRGGFYFLNRGKPQELQIRTASANGALKGTEFAMRVTDGKTTLAMFEGEVELSNPQGRLLLKSGEIGEAELGRKPRRTSKIEAINIIQWCLYYPGVLDPAELGPDRSASLDAYRAGDLPRALDSMKGVARTKGGRLLRAALILSSGQVEKGRAALAGVRADDPARQAIERMIAAVQFREWTGGEPRTASEWVAESYYKQSRGELEAALEAARKATVLSPDFGFAWVRAAEMEFSFGRTLKAMKLLERGLELAPRNAQALALQGFLLAAENRTGAARRSFDEAIALDGALGNAWLGRGLTSIRQGREEEGRLDLQTAAVLEPTRSALRSYLGKAFSEVGRNAAANIEFGRAKELDARDPTPWLYSAIQRKQENRYNEAVADLEKSIDLNENRSVFRSRFLLDQDRSIRGTNLAAIYLNNGMTEQSVREAVRAVDANYASAPAHLFLANSYDALRDPSGVLTRYEAVTFNELLLSHLLSPVGGGPLSQFVSQQEYSKLFEKDGLGFATDTTYLSTGEIRATATQYGTVGNLSYALDGFYHYRKEPRPNQRFSQAGGFGTFKLQLGPQDTAFFQVSVADTEGGELLQHYDARAFIADPRTHRFALTEDFQEKQDPGLLLLGWQHEWSPNVRTLLLLGRLADRQITTADSFRLNVLPQDVEGVAPPDFINAAIEGRIPRDAAYFRRLQDYTRLGTPYAFQENAFDLNYRSSFTTYLADLEHIITLGPNTLIFGGRFQSGRFDTSVRLTNLSLFDAGDFNRPAAHQAESLDLERINVHVYDVLRLTSRLSLTGGLAYDRLRYPENFQNPPIARGEAEIERVSPKAGFILEPWRGAVLRGAYAETVSGSSFEESIRLEPTQVAGFVQSYRSLASESVAGSSAGSTISVRGLSFEQKLPTRTYFGIEFEAIEQSLDRAVGVFEQLESLGRFGLQAGILGTVPSSLGRRDSYREEALTATLNQLIGDRWSFGARYRFTHSRLDTEFANLDDAIARGGVAEAVETLVDGASQRREATLHTLSLFALYNHPGGFFARGEAHWRQQDNNEFTKGIASFTDLGRGQARPNLHVKNTGARGDDFWQFNVLAGWRFHRNRCELSGGVLNLGAADYRLDPLSPYEESPRQRTWVVRCKLDF